MHQGLKQLSDWNACSQVFTYGELIEGLEIVREMSESGDLVETLE